MRGTTLIAAVCVPADDITGSCSGDNRIHRRPGGGHPGLASSWRNGHCHHTAGPTHTDDRSRRPLPGAVPHARSVPNLGGASGFRPLEQQDIQVRLGQRVELMLTMEVGGVAQAVTVTGAAPVVDRSRTTTGAVIDSETLARLPVGRRFSDTLYIAPGVSSGGQVGDANPSMSAAAASRTSTSSTA